MSLNNLKILISGQGEKKLTPNIVLDLVRELRVEGEMSRGRAFELGITNEIWCTPRAGAGYWGRAQTQSRSQAEYFGGVYAGGQNVDSALLECSLLPDLLATWTSLITKSRPSAVAVPGPKVVTDDDPLQALERSAQAAGATALLEYLESEFQFTSLVDDLVRYGGTHGTAGLLTDLVNDKISARVVFLPDLFIDDRARFDDAEWMIHRTWLDEYTAFNRMQKGNVPNMSKGLWPSVQTYWTVDGVEHQGVEVLDLWYRPSARLPKGLRATLISNQLVMAGPYELVSETEDGGVESWLPLSLFRPLPSRSSVWGDTWMTRCVDWQRTLNEAWSRQLQLFRQTQKAIILLPKSMLANDGAEEINPDPGVAGFDDAQTEAVKQIRYVVPPTLDSGLQALKQQTREAIYEIAGIQTADSLKGDSGKAIAYKEDLDLQKNQSTAKDLERCLLDFWRHVLGMVQIYYPQARQQAITGGLGDLAEADLAGVDIRLEPRSGWDGLTTTKAFNAAQAITDGSLTPGMGGLVRGDVLALANAAAAQAAVDQVLTTGAIDIDPSSFPQPEILVEVVGRAYAKALRQKDFQAAETLKDFQAGLLVALAGAAPPMEGEVPQGAPVSPGDMDVDRPVPAALMEATDLAQAPDIDEAPVS